MRLVILISISLILTSCIHKRVQKKFKEYCPYKINDILVFQNSTTFNTDTFFVTTVKDLAESDGPIHHFVNRHTYACSAYTSDFKDYLKLNPREQTKMIEIIPNYRPGSVRPYTNGVFFTIKNKSFKLFYFLPIDSLNKQATITLKINHIIYSDVQEIEIPYDCEFSFKGNITKFFWSKKHGYLKMVLDNKMEFILISKTNEPEITDNIKKCEHYKDDNWHKKAN